ncbi:hypothetical protein BpHYR1_029520 [Brachionus plicatilis]|uniref:Uncharacterized protein n=1 Tax=Brachionus plicatilis TaxID=10195 RepID=A0A3M7R6R7_BRAPC|nr:hypothetical protein BpHYR1_029520 [Brachionus plicatilis]
MLNRIQNDQLFEDYSKRACGGGLLIYGQGVPLVDDSVGEEVSSLLTFGRDLARKSSPVSPNIISWCCLRQRVAMFHRFHPAYSVVSAVEIY